MASNSKNLNFARSQLISILRGKINICLILMSVISFSLQIFNVIPNSTIRLYLMFFAIALLVMAMMSIIYKLYNLLNKTYNGQIPSLQSSILDTSNNLVSSLGEGSMERAVKKDKEIRELISPDNFLYELLNPFLEKEMIRSKKDFEYNIIVDECREEPYNENFFRAFFDISFSGFLTNDEVIIETARTVDEFHETYKKLQGRNRSVYRYILKTQDRFSIDDTVFNLKEVTINERLKLKVDKNSKSKSHVEFICTHKEGGLEELKEQVVKYKLKIETLIDKRQNEFTIIFGYPVQNLRTSFTFANHKVGGLDVIDMITPSSKSRKRELSGNNRIGASTKLDGWVIPYSGIVYTWRN